jgi:hypothetical protein
MQLVPTKPDTIFSILDLHSFSRSLASTGSNGRCTMLLMRNVTIMLTGIHITIVAKISAIPRRPKA